MTTKLTIEDVMFAENYVRFVSTRSLDAEQRARAKVLVGMLDFLDLRHPEWRHELIEHFASLGFTPETAEMFQLPNIPVDRFYDDLINILAKKGTSNG